MRTLLFVFGLAVSLTSASLTAAPASNASIRSGRVVVGEFKEVVMPPLPQVASPVDTFRELLALTPEQRERALAEKPETHRAKLRTKLAEYDGLTSEEREIRLRVTDLRWRLLPLMQMDPTNRAGLLRAVPLKDRRLIQERLEPWDQLSPEARKQLLDNQAAFDYFARLDSSSPAQREALLQTVPAERRAQVEEGFQRWRAQPSSDRDRLYRSFTQFFELTERERERILAALPASQRTQAHQTLDAIAKLPEAQRNRCLESYRKFTSLSPVEREQFAKNAERWQAMSESSRENWRQLTRNLPPLPPLPPGLAVPPLSSVDTPR